MSDLKPYPANPEQYRYILLLQPDGIGTQYIYLSQLLHFAMETNRQILLDFRRLAFFDGWDIDFQKKELEKVFSFNSDSILYDPVQIDEIIRTHASEILATRFSTENFDPTHIPFAFSWAKDLLGEMRTTCGLENYISLTPPYQAIFEGFQPTLSNAMGVHARLGNGEELRVTSGYRMMVPKEDFFEVIDRCENKKIFVCTDTAHFLEACRQRYGSRVVTLDRYRPPANCGPGHNSWSIQDNLLKESYMEARNWVGPYQILAEAALEMFLLGHCKELICNQSSFTHYARVCRNIPTRLLN